MWLSPHWYDQLPTRNDDPVTTELRWVEVAATELALPTSSSVVRSAVPAVACSLRRLEEAAVVMPVMVMSAVLLMYGGMYNHRA